MKLLLNGFLGDLKNEKFLLTGAMLFIYFIFSWASITNAQNGLKSEQISAIENSITQVMADCQIPGVAIAILKDANVVYEKGFGYRDLEKKLKVTPETVFPIGSCSKAFTAFTVGLLIDQGKLEGDKPVVMGANLLLTLIRYRRPKMPPPPILKSC